MLIPLAQTPMDSKGGRAQAEYSKKVHKILANMTPWVRQSSRRGEHLRGKVKPGETVVLLGGSDRADFGLYKGAKVARE